MPHIATACKYFQSSGTGQLRTTTESSYGTEVAASLMLVKVAPVDPCLRLGPYVLNKELPVMCWEDRWVGLGGAGAPRE